MSVRPIPEGYHSVTPYLIIRDCAKAIAFYKQVFGAIELMRLNGPDGIVAHAEIKIGNSPIMLADEFPDMGAKSPHAYGGSPVSLMIYVPDCDATFQAAIDAGATVDRPLTNQFYGDRSGSIIDPFGHKWAIATHVEDVPPDEIERRMAAMMQS